MSEIEAKGTQTDFDKYVDTLDIELIKKNFLKAYKKLFGNISGSCRAAGIVRQTFYNWKAGDTVFAQELAKIEPEEDFLDALEAEMRKQAVVDGNTTMCIFLAKTKGKKRGYVERTEHIVGEQNIEIDIEKSPEEEKPSE